MQIGTRSYEVDWGHLTFATFLTLACVAYLFDARAVSTNVQNLLLVQPAAILAVMLYLCILPQCFRPAGSPRASLAADENEGDGRTEMIRVGSLSAALGFFGFSFEAIGFDIATWLFVLATMFICGERRPWMLLVFSLTVAVTLVYALRALVPFPMPTAVL